MPTSGFFDSFKPTFSSKRYFYIYHISIYIIFYFLKTLNNRSQNRCTPSLTGTVSHAGPVCECRKHGRAYLCPVGGRGVALSCGHCKGSFVTHPLCLRHATALGRTRDSGTPPTLHLPAGRRVALSCDRPSQTAHLCKTYLGWGTP